MKYFKNKKTKEIVTYENGVLRANQFVIELGAEPSPEFWEELKDKYPAGTKIRDTYEGTFGLIYEKLCDGFWKIGDVSNISISEPMIGDGKRFRIVEESKLYPLEYKDLKNGYYYTTHYPKQGLYTFKCGCGLWVSHNSKTVHKAKGNFTPYNGFKEFRNATLDEIKMLSYVFITEDGVEIYNGDIYYAVNKKDFKISIFKLSECKPLTDDCVRFSNKKAAEDYILLNKPCLSIKDVQSVYKSAKEGYTKNGHKGVEYYRELKKIVESKIKQQ